MLKPEFLLPNNFNFPPSITNPPNFHPNVKEFILDL